MANTAKNAILRAKLAGVLTDLMPKTITDNVYVNDTTTLTAYLATLATSASVTELQNAVNALGTLASKNQISQSDLDTALQTLINGKAEASALTEEVNRAKAAEEANAAAAKAAQDLADANKGKIDTLVGTDTGKSVRTIANEELAAQLIGDNAKESLDTLEEIAAWIQSHPDDASAMNTAITALQSQLKNIPAGAGTVKQYVDDAVDALKIGDYAKAADLTTLASRVTQVETTIGTQAQLIEGIHQSINGLGDMAGKDVVTESDLDTDLKAKVNAAAEGNHSHDNKALLDTYDQTNADIKAAVQAKHTHSNQVVLNGITENRVNAWDAKANVYYSATQPENMADGDLWVQIIE